MSSASHAHPALHSGNDKQREKGVARTGRSWAAATGRSQRLRRVAGAARAISWAFLRPTSSRLARFSSEQHTARALDASRRWYRAIKKLMARAQGSSPAAAARAPASEGAPRKKHRAQGNGARCLRAGGILSGHAGSGSLSVRPPVPGPGRGPSPGRLPRKSAAPNSKLSRPLERATSHFLHPASVQAQFGGPALCSSLAHRGGRSGLAVEGGRGVRWPCFWRPATRRMTR
jgi:hypothetical protein